jgi:hypothetical protein
MPLELLRLLRSFGFSTRPWKNCPLTSKSAAGTRSGQEILGSEKCEAAIVDCDHLKGGLVVLESLRKGPANRNSSFSHPKRKHHKATGVSDPANFVLQKPISSRNAMHCFSAAVNFMIRERGAISVMPWRCLLRSYLAVDTN